MLTNKNLEKEYSRNYFPDYCKDDFWCTKTYRNILQWKLVYAAYLIQEKRSQEASDNSTNIYS